MQKLLKTLSLDKVIGNIKKNYKLIINIILIFINHYENNFHLFFVSDPFVINVC
jgi:hypothetical protein